MYPFTHYLHFLHGNKELNTLRPRQNGHHFADDTFKPIFLNENIRISIKIWLKFVPKVPINNIPALVQIMAWHWPGDKPLSEPMMVCLLTYICITRPQWVKSLSPLVQGWGMRDKHDKGLNCLSSVLPSKMGQPQHDSPECNQGWYCWSYLLYN